MTTDRVLEILAEAKKLAQQYRLLTGKPLGITGEVAEYEAARILGVELTQARHPGYDATEVREGNVFRLQIKGRCVLNNSKPGQRIGSIDIKKEFDAVLVVLLDEHLNATRIYEAPRDLVIREITKPGSKARNNRGSLGISKFKSIATQRWPSPMLALNKQGKTRKAAPVNVLNAGPDQNLASDLDVFHLLQQIRKPNESWANLRRGCMMLLDQPVIGGTKNTRASAKSFATRACRETGQSAATILDSMDRNDV